MPAMDSPFVPTGDGSFTITRADLESVVATVVEQRRASDNALSLANERADVAEIRAAAERRSSLHKMLIVGLVSAAAAAALTSLTVGAVLLHFHVH